MTMINVQIKQGRPDVNDDKRATAITMPATETKVLVTPETKTTMAYSSRDNDGRVVYTKMISLGAHSTSQLRHKVIKSEDHIEMLLWCALLLM